MLEIVRLGVRELLEAQPVAGVTVARVAARWGFAHHGRQAEQALRRFRDARCAHSLTACVPIRASTIALWPSSSTA